MIKSDALLLIRQMADDPDAKRWTAANFNILAGVTLDQLWGRIFEIAPYFRSQRDQVGAKADGYVDLRQVGTGYLFTDTDLLDVESILGLSPGDYDTLDDLMSGEGYATQADLYSDLVGDSDAATVALLAGGGGQLTYRRYKVQAVSIDGQSFGESTQKDVVEPASGEDRWGMPLTHVIMDDKVYLYDEKTLQEGAATLAVIRYSYYPTTWASVAATDPVPWVDGFDMVYVNEIAGRMLMKGGAEDPRTHLSLAAADMRDLLAKVKKETVGSTVMQAFDDPMEWGSTE